MSSKDFDGREYGIGSVRGIRAFDVDGFGRLMTVVDGWSVLAPSLTGKHMYIDEDGRTSNDPPKRKVRPEEHSLAGCTHGFYAYYDGSNDYRTDARISAVVEGYGDAIIGTRGFRASKARIVALCIPGQSHATDTGSRKPKRERRRIWSMRIVWSATNGVTVANALTQYATHHVSLGLMYTVTAAAMFATSFFFPSPPSRAKKDNAYEAAAAALKRYQIGAAGKPELDSALLAKVQRNYPDVPVFGRFEDMVTAFPPDKGLESSPETDPHFWEVSA